MLEIKQRLSWVELRVPLLFMKLNEFSRNNQKSEN